jgi:hypothetical protein
MEANPEHASRIVADLDATLARLGGRLRNGDSGGPGTVAVIGDGKRCNNLVTPALVDSE